jgi:hypothetical protein
VEIAPPAQRAVVNTLPDDHFSFPCEQLPGEVVVAKANLGAFKNCTRCKGRRCYKGAAIGTVGDTYENRIPQPPCQQGDGGRRQNRCGEGGIRSGPFSQPRRHHGLSAQVLILNALAYFGDGPGHCGLFGVVWRRFSTKVAHPFGRRDHGWTAIRLGGQRRSAPSRRKRSARGSPSTDDTLPCASYARFSSALQKEESITDQQRRCR